MLVITAFQRSGTTALGEQLGGAPKLAYWGEVFHPEGYEAADPAVKLRLRSGANWFRFAEDRLPPELKSGPQDEAARREAWRLYTEHLTSLGSGRRPILDVKYNSWRHLEPVWSGLADRPLLMRLIEEQDGAYVHLLRANVLAQALSEQFAFTSGLWHRRHGQALDLAELRFDADIEGLLARMRQSRSETEIMREWLRPTPHVELVYEDTFTEAGVLSEGALQALANLGVEAADVPERAVLGRVGQSPREWVANADAVADALAGTEFGPLVAETLG